VYVADAVFKVPVTDVLVQLTDVPAVKVAVDATVSVVQDIADATDVTVPPALTVNVPVPVYVADAVFKVPVTDVVVGSTLDALQLSVPPVPTTSAPDPTV